MLDNVPLVEGLVFESGMDVVGGDAVGINIFVEAAQVKLISITPPFGLPLSYEMRHLDAPIQWSAIPLTVPDVEWFTTHLYVHFLLASLS